MLTVCNNQPLSLYSPLFFHLELKIHLEKNRPVMVPVVYITWMLMKVCWWCEQINAKTNTHACGHCIITIRKLIIDELVTRKRKKKTSPVLIPWVARNFREFYMKHPGDNQSKLRQQGNNKFPLQTFFWKVSAMSVSETSKSYNVINVRYCPNYYLLHALTSKSKALTWHERTEECCEIPVNNDKK